MGARNKMDCTLKKKKNSAEVRMSICDRRCDEITCKINSTTALYTTKVKGIFTCSPPLSEPNQQNMDSVILFFTL